MAVNMMMPLRGAQAVLSITVLGLMAYVSSWWTGHWHQLSPMEVNWMIFAPIWTLLSLIYLVLAPMKFPVAANKWAMLAVELITGFYWFGGFIALAVFLSDRICFGTVCMVAKAGTAISAFQWVCWAATAVLMGLGLKRGNAGMRASPKVEMHQGV